MPHQTNHNVAAPASKRVPGAVSRGIAVARVICIFCVMFVHTWPSNHAIDLTGIVSPAFQLVLTLAVDVLGRSSVPLLSIVSG